MPTCINPCSRVQRHLRVLKPTLWTLDCLKTEVCTVSFKGLAQGHMWHIVAHDMKQPKHLKTSKKVKKDRAVVAYDLQRVCHVCSRVAQEQFLVNYIAMTSTSFISRSMRAHKEIIVCGFSDVLLSNSIKICQMCSGYAALDNKTGCAGAKWHDDLTCLNQCAVLQM